MAPHTKITEIHETRFIVRGDGTIIDCSTELMWMQHKEIEKSTISKALQMVVHFDGYDDWRLPSSSELKSMMPMNDIFPPKKYLSSTIKAFPTVSGNYYDLISSDGVNHLIREDSSKEEHIIFVRKIDYFPLSRTTSGSGTGIATIKTIEGLKNKNSKVDAYIKGSKVEIKATPNNDSFFKCWRGDLEGNVAIGLIYIDGPKSVIAEFELLTYPLSLQITGSGEGSITPSIMETEYPHGSIVTLTAAPTQGSRFKRWGGDAHGSTPETEIRFDGKKTVTAEFVRVFALTVSIEGEGLVVRSVIADAYETDSTVTLTAKPIKGHEFVQWHGAATGENPVCTLAMNASKVVKAEFRPLPMFSLKVTHTGTGNGVVLPTRQEYWRGSVVELVAKAADGCVFDGWGGDINEGLAAVREVTVNSNLTISAKFSRVEVPDTDIAVTFDEVNTLDTRNGGATVFYFTVSNRTDKQIRIEIPLAGYVTTQGEEIEQSGWAKGMMDGAKGVTLRAGRLRQMGLAFDSSRLDAVVLGEHLHITLLQNTPAQQLTFSYRCTGEDGEAMTLVNASIEPLSEKADLPSQAELVTRIQALENALQEVLSQLNASSLVAPPPAVVPTQTFHEVLAWLCTQNSLPLAMLRQKLLPLGLMPSAVMNDVNERAFDVAGEPALEEAADTVTVQRKVLLQVLAVW